MSRLRLAVIVGLVASTAAGPSNASARNAAPRCFHTRDWNGWTITPDARSMYIRTGVRSLYRLDFVGGCQAARDVGAHLVTRTRGSGWICDALDLDLKVANGHGFATPCIISKITHLSADEVAALPKSLRP